MGEDEAEVIVDDTGSTETSYIDDSAVAGQTYIYHVQALGSGGAGAQSQPAQVRRTDQYANTSNGHANSDRHRHAYSDRNEYAKRQLALTRQPRPSNCILDSIEQDRTTPSYISPTRNRYLKYPTSNYLPPSIVWDYSGTQTAKTKLKVMGCTLTNSRAGARYQAT